MARVVHVLTMAILSPAYLADWLMSVGRDERVSNGDT